MPVHTIQGRLFVEPSDIEGVKKGTLCSMLFRARKLEGKNWKNVSNPNFNGKNARRLLLVSSLPKQHQERVMEKFGLAVEQLRQDLNRQVTIQQDKGSSTQIVVEATSKVLQVGQSFILDDIHTYLDKEWKKYSGHYVELGCCGKKIIAYARTCALVEKIWEVLDSTFQNTHPTQKDIKRLKLSIIVNLQTIIVPSLNVQVPKCERRLSEWLHDVLQAGIEDKEVYDIVQPKNRGNSNRSELTDGQKKIADQMRSIGKASSIQDIYTEFLQIGKSKGWWMKEGIYTPPSYTTIARYFSVTDNLLSLGREGYISNSNYYQPSIKRTLPTKKNALWVLDGSPLDILVYWNGKARQYMNSFRLFDTASNKKIGFSSWRGGGEPSEKAIECLKDGIRQTGYSPEYLQTDGGSASTYIKLWCEQVGIKWMAAQKGKARNKYAEQLIGRFGKVLRQHPAWSGQNRTALGRNSQTSAEHKQIAGRYATSFEALNSWVRNEAIPMWNNSIIKTLASKPCNKSPNQLWEELESYTTKLSDIDKAIHGGYYHRVKLTIEGLKVYHKNEPYVYFPNLDNEAGFNKGLEIFANTPRKHHPEKSKLTLYLLEYGSKAFLFDKDFDKGGKYLDTWTIKPTISMTASLEGESKELQKVLAFQKAWNEKAKQKIEQANITASAFGVESPPSFTAKRRNKKTDVATQYRKETLHEEEFEQDDEGSKIVVKETEEYVDKAHPYTGEIIRFKKSSIQP